jgi:hypothetical protein
MPSTNRPWEIWSRVAAFSATSTGFMSGISSTEVLSCIAPVSGARRASTGNGWGQIVGCDSQWWPIDTQP